jgi:hypothetical protein
MHKYIPAEFRATANLELWPFGANFVPPYVEQPARIVEIIMKMTSICNLVMLFRYVG